MLLETLSRLGSIILIDLMLAGDNALVIGMAARRLPAPQRRRVIILGSAAAVALRLGFATIITLLLNIPLLSAVGGLLLFWIARQVVRDDQHNAEVAAGTTMFEAVKIIILADLVMSLDNVLALAGVAQGDTVLLAIGLLLTVPLIIWGSTLISTIMNRLPWLTYIGVAVLLWTGTDLIWEDPAVHDYLPEFLVIYATWWRLAITLLGTAVIGWAAHRQRRLRDGEGQPAVAETQP